MHVYFIDEHQEKMFSLFDQVNVMNPAAIHTLSQYGSLRGSGQDCWLAIELERWNLVFRKFTAARSKAFCGQSVVLLKSKEVARQVAVLETEIFCHR